MPLGEVSLYKCILILLIVWSVLNWLTLTTLFCNEFQEPYISSYRVQIIWTNKGNHFVAFFFINLQKEGFSVLEPIGGT